MKPGLSKKVVVAAVLGNALEFYDFAAYAFFAVYIGQAFFPASTPFASLLLSLGAFGVGFVFRPLGGVLIGAFADSAGRRPAMLLTIVLITTGTVGLALTPSYSSIGLAAPVIVVLCRLVQGLAIGGEVGPASAFLIEIAPTGRRGLYGSWGLSAQVDNVPGAAGTIGLVLSLLLDKADLAAWGWRVPFLLSLLLVPVGLYLRRMMPETLEKRAATAPSWGAALGRQVRLLVLAVLIILGGTVSTYVGVYMTTYAIATLHLPPSTALTATVVGGLATAVFALLGGWMSDIYGRRLIILAPRVLTAIVTALPCHSRAHGADGDERRRDTHGRARASSAIGEGRRVCDRLRGRRFPVRGHDAAGRHLAHRCHRRSQLARLVRDGRHPCKHHRYPCSTDFRPAERTIWSELALRDPLSSPTPKRRALLQAMNNVEALE